MKSNEKENLLKKLYSSSCTEEELEFVFQLVPSLSKTEAQQVMAALWQQVDEYPALQAKLSNKMFKNILTNIDQEGSENPAKKRPVLVMQRQRFLTIALQVAAVLLVGVGAFWLWFIPSKSTIITTAFGEQKTIELPDGSQVRLNANSFLEYSDNWDNKEDRRVWLKGEAFFEVTKKQATGQKFQVITNDLTVEVLGTVFNVNSYHQQTNVFLEEGKIALQLKHQPDQLKIMQPGETLTYSSQQNQIVANKNDASSALYTSWKDGVLIFEDTPLPTVLQKIEQIYGIAFSVPSTINEERKITAGLPMEEVEIVLPMLEQALGIEIKQKDGKYIIQE